MICNICPHKCNLGSGEIGRCNVIQNNNGILINKYENKISTLTIDPIEKRPFFHYKPGSKFLSVGGLGCNFVCQFCFNFSVSQSVIADTVYKTPYDLYKIYLDKKNNGICFTYNEPILYYQYINRLSEFGVDIILKTNGFGSKEIIDDLCQSCSAFNVDIKGNDENYKEICGGILKPVLESIQNIYDHKKHLEISYLVLPNQINDLKFHEEMSIFLSDLSVDIPVHLLYFYPFYKLAGQSYDLSCLSPIIDIFQKRMKYVYLSNTYQTNMMGLRDTKCYSCNKILISRQKDIVINSLECCGKRIKGIF